MIQYLNPIYVISHLIGQKKIQLKDILFCKRNYIFRIIYFQSRNAHTSPSFRESNILKLPDKNPLKNYPLIKKI